MLKNAVSGLLFLSSLSPTLLATQDVAVVVMDSGVVPWSKIKVDRVRSHAFLGKSPFEDPSILGPLTPFPYGHGTINASIISSIDEDATIISYRIFIPTEDGKSLTTSYKVYVEAFEAACKLDAERVIVNASFMVSGDVSDPDASQVKEAIRSCTKMLVITAAGNDGLITPNRLCKFELPTIGCVGSTNERGGLAWFSNWGPLVNIAALGENVPGIGNDGSDQKFSGTSVSGPIVSGVASRYWRSNLWLTGAQLLEIILKRARFNPLLIGKISGARDLNIQGIQTALEQLASGTPVPEVSVLSISAIVPAWTTEPGLAWGGIATVYGGPFDDGNVKVLVNQFPVPITYIDRWQINFQLPMDPFQFPAAENVISVVKSDDQGNIISWGALEKIRPAAYNPGFLTGEDGKLVTEVRDNTLVIFAVGLGFTNQWIRAGSIGNGTERVMQEVQIFLDGERTNCSATASGSTPGLYELRIPTPTSEVSNLTVRVGENFQRSFVLK